MMTDALVHCQQATFFARADTRTKMSTLCLRPRARWHSVIEQNC